MIKFPKYDEFMKFFEENSRMIEKRNEEIREEINKEGQRIMILMDRKAGKNTLNKLLNDKR